MNSSTEKPSSSVVKLSGFPLTATSGNEAPGDNDTGKNIKCPSCDRKFQNFQALGGHQNAHRRERQMAMLARLQYMNPHQDSLMFRAATPVVVAEGEEGPSSSVLPSALSATAVFGGATADDAAQLWRARAPPALSVAEPPGTRHPNFPFIVQVPDVGVDNIDLELRLATSSKESPR